MALLDFLKNKKAKDKTKEKKVSSVKSSEAGVLPAAKQSNGTGKVSAGKFSYEVIKDPHISEKGTRLAEKNKYVFKVYDRSNKLEIKKSVEGIYNVDVVAVNVITIPHKKRRLGKTEGFKKGYKKALVTIKEGQKIEIF